MNCENFIFFNKAFQQFDFAKENYPEKTLSIYGDENFDETKKAESFRNNIRDGLSNAKIFEVSDDIKKLLMMTDTPIKNDEIHLPFPTCFVDVQFSKEELAELGIEIKAEKIIGIIGREGQLINQNKELIGKDLLLTMLSINFTTDENMPLWFDSFNKNCNIYEEYKDSKILFKENPTTDKVARDFVHKFFLNFLNFVNNPEVELVEHKRSEKNIERKIKQGKAIIPSSFTIKVSGKLKEYIDEAVEGMAGWHFNYRFWVRGHFRDLQSDRYKEKKRIWILPFVKGKGILVDKSYQVKVPQQ